VSGGVVVAVLLWMVCIHRTFLTDLKVCTLYPFSPFCFMSSLTNNSVNLVDFEHPFFSRVWHGVHILDSTSPLLTDEARQTIQANHGSWPSAWFEHPTIIQEKLDFEDLIVTVAGVSNVSAVTVHAYKRYKIGDVLIGYNFAPLVFRDRKTGILEVDLSLANDVREQNGLQGEDLTEREREDPMKKKESLVVSMKKEGVEVSEQPLVGGGGGGRPSMTRQSTIRIKPSGKSFDALDDRASPTVSVRSASTTLSSSC
jgi:hypothetical protein